MYIYIYILGYIAIGLGVAKFFQRWIDKNSLPHNKLDLGGFCCFCCGMANSLNDTLHTINRTVLYSQEDLIKYIIAHEFCHATYGHRDNFKLPMGGIDRHAMELCCDSFALAATGIRN